MSIMDAIDALNQLGLLPVIFLVATVSFAVKLYRSFAGDDFASNSYHYIKDSINMKRGKYVDRSPFA